MPYILKILRWNDVCRVVNGDIRGTRIDNLNGNRAYCNGLIAGYPGPDPYLSREPNPLPCTVLTTLPATGPLGLPAAQPPPPRPPPQVSPSPPRPSPPPRPPPPAARPPRPPAQAADFRKIDIADQVPAGFRHLTCEEAELYFWDFLQGEMIFNDVCRIQGGVAIGPRADGKPDSLVLCPYNLGLQVNCAYVTYI